MKTTTKLTLTALTAALLSTSAALADSVYRNPVQPAQSQQKVATTIAFGGSVKSSAKAPVSGQKTLKQINTAHGTATYFAE